MLIRFLRQNVLVIAAVLVAGLIFCSALMVFYNRHSMADNSQIKELSGRILNSSTEIQLQGLVNYDKNLRGYGISPTDNFIGHIKYNVTSTQSSADSLASLLQYQKASMPVHSAKIDSFLVELSAVKVALKNYHDFGQSMMEMIQADSLEDFRQALQEDRGAHTWGIWNHLHSQLETFENSVAQAAQKEYDTAASRNLWVQGLLLLLGVPTVFGIVRTLRRQERGRKSLLLHLQQTNHQYLFHPGADHEVTQESKIVEESIDNLKRAANFITRITQGEDAQWDGITLSNQELNQNTLVGELIKMQQRMKQVKREDSQRNWSNEGLNLMGEILRKETDLASLTNTILIQLVKYVNANQGALFLLHDENTQPYLELKAMYAYNRKKYQTARIEIGEGLVGQAVLEKDTVYLTDVPQDYLKITSGLGLANPNCLLLVPLKVNDGVQGVIELASFEKLEAYKVSFIEKLAEQMASAIVSVRTNEKTKKLLQATQEQAEEMKSQEEEMRQNMEELAATQEEMHRVLRDAQNREAFTSDILNATTDSIIAIDANYKIISCNTTTVNTYKQFGLNVGKGFDIFNLFTPEQRATYKAYYDRALQGERFEATERYVFGDREQFFVIAYSPLRDEDGLIIGAVVFGKDVTDIMLSKKKSEELLEATQEQAEEMKAQEEVLRQSMEELATIQEELQRKEQEYLTRIAELEARIAQ